MGYNFVSCFVCGACFLALVRCFVHKREDGMVSHGLIKRSGGAGAGPWSEDRRIELYSV